MELIETVYSEPTSPIIIGSFLADEAEVESLSNETHKTKSLKIMTKSFGISDMSRRQKESDLNRLTVQDKDLDTIIIDL